MKKLFLPMSVSLVTMMSCTSVHERITHKPVTRSVTSESEVSWQHYAGDLAATKFSKANLINPSNVKGLKQAWKWSSVDNKIAADKKLVPMYYEGTPIMKNGVLYTVSSFNIVTAHDPHTGKELWSFDPKVYEEGYPTNLGFVQRGLALKTQADGKDIIFLNTNNNYLYAIDAQTGQLMSGFGTEDKIDLKLGLGRQVSPGQYSMTSPPLVCGNTVVVGSSVKDITGKFDTPPGDVRGFDVRTGKQKWQFRTIPQGNAEGSDTWENGSNTYMGNTNVWTFMSADEELNAVYLPTSTPTNDFYGGERKGDNLFGESIVSVNCDTGHKNWHYQIVRHGLWDYDLPTAPILMDLTVRRKNSQEKIKALAQVTKQGFIFALNRENGEPIWDVVEKGVLPSDVPGERAAEKQRFPTKPEPFDRQGFYKKDVINFTPEIRKEAMSYIQSKDFRFGGLYTPPSLEGTFTLPGNIGGASWAGAAFNPLNNTLYVPSITLPYVTKLIPAPAGSDTLYVRDLGSAIPRQPNGLPLTQPPYGRITAYKMSEGKKSWMKPVGNLVNQALAKHPSMTAGKMPKKDLGSPRRIHMLVTPSLLFASQDGSADVVGFQNAGGTLVYKIGNEDPKIRVFNPETGALIAEIPLEGNSFGAPMTYIHEGKQYLVLPYGGANLEAGLVAYSID